MSATAPDTIAALVGGGILSLALLEELGKKYKTVVPIYVVCGFIWEPAERFWLRRVHRQMKKRHNSIGEVIDISLPIKTIYRRGYWATDGGEVPGLYAADSLMELPGRNLALLTVAAIFCQTNGVKEMAIGALATTPFADASQDFFKQFEETTKLGLRKKVRILTPLAQAKRAALIKKADDLPLDLTFSCINPRGHNHCGNCYKCGERRRAFEEAGKTDPTNYEGAG
jgi:7-cyano-7-deazaguanine synthase